MSVLKVIYTKVTGVCSLNVLQTTEPVVCNTGKWNNLLSGFNCNSCLEYTYKSQKV